jgi:hypothetical protein
VVAVAGVGCALVATIAVAAVAPGAHSVSRNRPAAQPSSGPYSRLSPPQQREVQRYVATAFEAARSHTRACSVGPRWPRGVNHGSPSPGLLSILGVLRRPATRADLPKFLSHGPGADLAPGIFVNYVRQARSAFGDSYYVVPAEAGQISAGCARAETLRLRSGLRGIPRALRPAAIELGKSANASEGPHQGVYVLEIGRHGASSGGGGASASEIEQRGGDFASDGIGGGAIFSGLVPDGVASIALHYPAKGSSSTSPRQLTITTRPVENVIVVKVPRQAEDAVPQKMVWLSAQGTTIKTISRAG